MGRTRFSSLGSAALAAASLWLSGCGDDEAANQRGSGPRSTGSFCERYDAIAKELGCKPLGSECPPLEAACEEPGAGWMSCVERDLRQCRCESGDRELNCEGSFKPDEGPARCEAEYRALDRCQG